MNSPWYVVHVICNLVLLALLVWHAQEDGFTGFEGTLIVVIAGLLARATSWSR